MNIVCVGGGSIGLLLAAKLAASKASVWLMTNQEAQAASLRINGLTLKKKDEPVSTHTNVRTFSFEHMAAQASDCSAPMLSEMDWVLLAVKQKHIDEPLLQQVSGLLGNNGRLLCFQNGIGHVDKITPHIDISRIFLAVTTEGARKLSGDCVVHTGTGMTWIGPAAAESVGLLQHESAAECNLSQKMIQNALNEAGFHTKLSNQMSEVVWNKLLINAVINPLTAMLRIRNGELLVTERRRQLMLQLLEEGKAAAQLAEVHVRDDIWEQITEVCEKTAQNVSSMLQDVSEGRTTEIDWINGAMVELARSRQLHLPLNEAIVALLKASEPIN